MRASVAPERSFDVIKSLNLQITDLQILSCSPPKMIKHYKII
jgi:hypothetical protein